MNWNWSKRKFSMNKWKYTVEWEGDVTNYKQDFETLEEARIAMILHHERNAVIKVIKIDEY